MRKISIEMMSLMCMFDHSGRAVLIKDMGASLPYIEDTDMADLMRQTIDMVNTITDEEFANIEFESTWDESEDEEYADSL